MFSFCLCVYKVYKVYMYTVSKVHMCVSVCGVACLLQIIRSGLLFRTVESAELEQELMRT